MNDQDSSSGSDDEEEEEESGGELSWLREMKRKGAQPKEHAGGGSASRHGEEGNQRSMAADPNLLIQLQMMKLLEKMASKKDDTDSSEESDAD
eukprot:10389582-Karenia_brevis.AAC.1